ncbi:MAG: hypothetical protein ACREV5_10435 [Steroidobacter sp.]
MAVAPPDDDCPPLEDEPGCDGMPEGSDELEPERPPEGPGMLGEGELRPPPPALPDEPPDEPLEEGGDELGEGIEEDEDCPAQPPINNADTALMLVI